MILRYNGKKIGKLYGRKLIKQGRQAVIFRAMDGFGMPQDLVDDVLDRFETSRINPEEDLTSHDGNRNVQTQARKVLRDEQGSKAPASFDIVEIHYQNKIYQTSLEKFKTKGLPYHRPPYEAQYILPRKEFILIDPKQLRMV
jgi:hypothetical protein